MGWKSGLLFFLALSHSGLALHLPEDVPEFSQLSENPFGLGNERTEFDPYEDEKLEKIGNLLSKLLVLPWPKGISPLLYVENYEDDKDIEEEDDQELLNAPMKRSRYYRKYPWKRQNSRYDAENRYLCQPSKEDVFRLLVALHEARQGNRSKTVHFCNRKRPASAIFTNIRFLGKRK